MHIAHIAPLIEAVPPKLYGGTERVVHWLTEELVALGHDVTLFASGDSRTSGKLEAVWPRALRLDGAVRDPNALHMMMLERVRQQADEFDCLHFHLDYYPFSLFSRQSVPFVTTLHGRLDLPEASAGLHNVSNGPGDFNFRLATPAAPSGRVDTHRSSRSAPGPAPSDTGQTELSCLPWPHCSGERHRPRDFNRATLRHSAQSRRQGRPPGPRLFPVRDQAAYGRKRRRIHRRD